MLGDFNFPTIQWINGSGFPVTLRETSFTDSLQDHGFLQLVTSPTRGSNILDLWGWFRLSKVRGSWFLEATDFCHPQASLRSWRSWRASVGERRA